MYMYIHINRGTNVTLSQNNGLYFILSLANLLMQPHARFCMLSTPHQSFNSKFSCRQVSFKFLPSDFRQFFRNLLGIKIIRQQKHQQIVPHVQHLINVFHIKLHVQHYNYTLHLHCIYYIWVNPLSAHDFMSPPVTTTQCGLSRFSYKVQF